MDQAKRFNHLRCGRRFGKTTLIEELSSISLDGKLVGIWFPTYKDLSEVWKDLKRTYKPIVSRQNEQLKQIELITKGLIDFWSMEDPDSGQGRKYHRAIIDEAAKAPKLYQAWENTIRPTLTDYKGDAFILSRPKGKNNGFYLLEEKHRQFDNWAFFHYTTYDNPHIDPDEVEEAKKQLDEINFLQEYMAEYVDANDRPFLYKFNAKVHVIDAYKPNPHLPILISFDFNKDPMTALIGQQVNLHTAYAFAEINLPEGSTPEVCDMILVDYPQWDGQMDVTGDATGRNRSALTVGNLNHYRIIKDKLRLKDLNLKIPPVNPAHSDSRVLCNSVLQNANFYITKNCKKTIRDAEMAYVDVSGELVKTQVEGLHHFDTLRYLIHAFYPDFIKNPNKYRNAA
jgi:Terminase-like family.